MKTIIEDTLAVLALIILCACAGCAVVDDALHPWPAEDWPSSGGGGACSSFGDPCE